MIEDPGRGGQILLQKRQSVEKFDLFTVPLKSGADTILANPLMRWPKDLPVMLTNTGPSIQNTTSTRLKGDKYGGCAGQESCFVM